MSLTLGLLSFSNGGALTMVEGESLVSSGKDTTISAGSYVGGSGGASSLVPSSGSTTGGSALLISGRGGLDNEWSVIISSSISSSAVTGPV